jgi:hypothetical protein
MAFSTGGAFGANLYSGCSAGDVSGCISTIPSTGRRCFDTVCRLRIANERKPFALRFGPGYSSGSDLYVGMVVVSPDGQAMYFVEQNAAKLWGRAGTPETLPLNFATYIAIATSLLLVVVHRLHLMRTKGQYSENERIAALLHESQGRIARRYRVRHRCYSEIT